MILAEIIDEYVSGDWGNEEFSDDMPNAAFCIRAADFMSILNVDYTNIPIRYFSDSSLENKQLKVGDIVIEKSGGSPTQSTGRVIIVTEELIKEKQHIVCSNFCESFRVKEGLDPFYVFCYLQFLYNERVFFNFEGKTSGLKNLQMEQVFSSIDIPEQKSDISILSSIDKKIALNRRTNNELESLAKQIYDYWFVQFDFPNEEGKPYKSSGGKMVWNETLKREIPAGWEINCLNNLHKKLTSGRRPAGGIDKKLKQGIPSLGAECIDRLGCFDYKSTPYVSEKYKEFVSCGIIDDNDILIYKDGAYVGKVTLYRDGFPFNYATVNEHVFLYHAYNEAYQEYILYTLMSQTYYIIMQNAGKAKAAQPGLNREDLLKIELVIPPLELAQQFHNTVNILHKRLFNNALQIKQLQSLRDFLLPLLMNGQVTIKD